MTGMPQRIAAPARTGRSTRAGRLGALLASLRVRIIFLMFAAWVPLLAMAGGLTWQNYSFVAHRSFERVTLVREAVVTRHQVAISALRQTMGALAGAPVLRGADPAACTALLANVAQLSPGHYAALAVVDQDGRVVCQGAGDLASDAAALHALTAAPWFAGALGDRRFGVGPVLDLAQPGSRVPAIPALYPVGMANGAAGAGPGRALLAVVAIDWLVGRSEGMEGEAHPPAAWLVREDGQPLNADGPGDASLPPGPALARLLRGDMVLTTTARDGHDYAYASARLGPELRLLVGYRETEQEASIRILLLKRLAELAALVVLGLVAVVVGAHFAVVRPVRQLDSAVRAWRGGAAFTDATRAGMPTEVLELSQSFTEATQALKEREMQLRGALSQQELLMQEIHHRVKNNLQIIASLLNLQASRIRQPQARAEFQSARDRVRALATLHRHLYPHGELHTINMRSFLTELCGQLFHAMGETEGERIALEIEAPELRMLSDQAVPLALIVTEVVGNALKFAFPDGRTGTISIRLSVEGEMAELSLGDDGVGLPGAEEDPREPGAAPSGIGMQLIRGFVRQLRATMEIQGHPGTRFLLRMPLHRERDVSAPAEDADAPA